MKSSLILLATIIALAVHADSCTVTDNAKCGRSGIASKIYNGASVSAREYPWIVSIESASGSQQVCTGTLINNNWVVTAAHCIQYRDGTLKDRSVLSIVAGSTDRTTNSLEAPARRYSIEAIFAHPNHYTTVGPTLPYSLGITGGETTWDWHYDIALIKIASPVEFSADVGTVCLSSIDYPERTPATSAGFGRSYIYGSRTLNKLNGTILYKQCQDDGKSPLNRVCINTDKSQLGSGDSGGPMFTLGTDGRYYQLGVNTHSWAIYLQEGNTFTGKTLPAGVRISKFLPWFKKVIESNDPASCTA